MIIKPQTAVEGAIEGTQDMGRWAAEEQHLTFVNKKCQGLYLISSHHLLLAMPEPASFQDVFSWVVGCYATYNDVMTYYDATTPLTNSGPASSHFKGLQRDSR